MSDIRTFEANADAIGQRLDRWLSDHLPDMSRNQVQTLIQKDRVKLNDGPVPKLGVALNEGDRVTVDMPPPPPSEVEVQDIPLDILYEDDEMIAINKADGMVVYPAPGHDRDTLINALLHHTPLASVGAPIRPGIVHRLDQATSGVIVVAKTDDAYHALVDQFKGRSLKKTYLAWVWDSIHEDRGRIDLPIGRDPNHRKKMAISKKGKEALSEFRVLKRLEDRSLVEVNILTGRTHQIRVHFAHIKHSVIGDPVYGRKKKARRMMLHAWKLKLQHPTTQEWIELEAPIPTEFNG